MRENVKCHSPQELHRFWLERDLHLKQRTIEDTDDGSLEVIAYLVVASVVWTACLLVWWYL